VLHVFVENSIKTETT